MIVTAAGRWAQHKKTCTGFMFSEREGLTATTTQISVLPPAVARWLLGVPESTVPSQAAGGWIRVADTPPELETLAWIVWNDHVQSQPWQWLARDESGPVWYFDGHEMPDGEVSHYMPVKVPPAPEKP